MFDEGNVQLTVKRSFDNALPTLEGWKSPTADRLQGWRTLVTCPLLLERPSRRGGGLGASTVSKSGLCLFDEGNVQLTVKRGSDNALPSSNPRGVKEPDRRQSEALRPSNVKTSPLGAPFLLENRRGAEWGQQRLVCPAYVCLMEVMLSIPWRIKYCMSAWDENE